MDIKIAINSRNFVNFHCRIRFIKDLNFKFFKNLFELFMEGFKALYCDHMIIIIFINFIYFNFVKY
jgi:hypothetical protein